MYVKKKLQKGKRTYKRRVKGTTKFAKAVMAVVNRKAESKMWAKDFGWTTLAYNATNSFNLTQGLGQGTATNMRIGDKIFIKNIRIGALIGNMTNGGNFSHNNSTQVRCVVFRGKYDYNISNYPLSELLEGSGGLTSTSSNVCARIDLNQVDLIGDKVINVPQNQVTGSIKKHYFGWTLPVNKTFHYREDDAYGKTQSIYVAFISEIGNVLDVNSINAHLSFTFTDV